MTHFGGKGIFIGLKIAYKREQFILSTPMKMNLLIPCLVIGLIVAGVSVPASAMTKVQRDALRAAKGKYKLSFNASAKIVNTMTMEELPIPITGNGNIRLPSKKGKAPVNLRFSGTSVSFNAIITKITVKRNGKSVSYRGISNIPDTTLGLGDLTGPFSGTVKIKRTKETLKAKTNMTGSPGMDLVTNLSANLRGKK